MSNTLLNSLSSVVSTSVAPCDAAFSPRLDLLDMGRWAVGNLPNN